MNKTPPREVFAHENPLPAQLEDAHTQVKVTAFVVYMAAWMVALALREVAAAIRELRLDPVLPSAQPRDTDPA